MKGSAAERSTEIREVAGLLKVVAAVLLEMGDKAASVRSAASVLSPI
jgi:hypothetical protein